ncbi:MAG: peptidase U32, partial [Methanomicrobiales archaeon]|nr:peptidase U32 [Methanomicrobiales archaeon]
LDGVMVAGGGEALAVRNCCPDLPLFGSAALNVFNYRAVRNYGRLFSGLTLSQELSGEQMRSLVRYARSDRSPALECIVHGAVELMVSEDCLCRTHAGMPDPSRAWTGIRDERGRIFPVTIDAACRTHVFNAVDTCLIDRIPELLAMEFDALAIDLRRRSGDSATVLAASYREAIERTASGDPGIEQILAAAKDRVKKLAAGGITAGHYLQGVPEQG